ncbi:Hpt domain-containing protein [Paracoccus xiamenensis]|uniref:Hpt domain-containing protein n=1 Tax=Paracoccus xiamenensis TaxID=2714901 RepID=UPI00140B26CB|nr:Hpt domain-containing protein [Paracoccus xiamenensis]NHF73126.1 Hpt domain-containing protein [Paracoccus xiamenensis]
MIDWKRVHDLREELGEEDFATVVELFLDEVEGIVMRIGHGDADQLENDLHFLKGSAANLGFTVFGQLCQQGEAECRNGHRENFDMAGLLDCYAATKRDFVAGISRRQSGVA